MDEEDAWVVLSIVQDGGWSAENGAGDALPLFRANGPFLALRLPAGNTRVRLRYSPPGFLLGAAISGITLAMLAAVALRAPHVEKARVSHPGSPFWVPSAALQRHLNRTATGNPDGDWLSHVRAEHLPRTVARTLVLGCGNGFLERALARQPGIGEILATDPDDASVEAAAKAARRAGLATVAYGRIDPDRDALPEGPWNLVLANDLLHHVADPERLLRSIREGLAPGGHFVFSEYTGPNRFQYAPARSRSWNGTSGSCPTGSAPTRTPAGCSGAMSPSTPRASRASIPPKPPRATPSCLWRGGSFRRRRSSPAEAACSTRSSRASRAISGQGSLEDERLLEVLCAEEARATSLGILAPLFTAFIGRRSA